MSIDIEKLAMDAGMETQCLSMGAASCVYSLDVSGVTRGDLERFAALVLEQAAQKCEELPTPDHLFGKNRGRWWNIGTMNCSGAIRAMKPKDE